MTDYILVSQDRPQVEHSTRQPDGTWFYRFTTGLAGPAGLEDPRA